MNMANQSQRPHPSVGTLDLNTIPQSFLSLPSPHHASFSQPKTPNTASSHKHTDPAATPSSRLRRSLHSFLTRFNFNTRYTKLSTSDIETATSNPDAHCNRHLNPSTPIRHTDADAASDTASETPSIHSTSTLFPSKPQPRITHTEYSETLTLLFLLLLLSLLFNFFLLFNGPVNCLPHRHEHRHSQGIEDELPHKGFRFQEHGKNYTCLEMEMRGLDLGLEDGEWGDLAGGLHRGIGKGREFAMVHQLRCLGVLRSEIKILRDGEVGRRNEHTDSVDCFEYLRQVVLCNADDTLEVDGGLRGERECRDAAWLFNVISSGGLWNEGEGAGELHREGSLGHLGWGYVEIIFKFPQHVLY